MIKRPGRHELRRRNKYEDETTKGQSHCNRDPHQPGSIRWRARVRSDEGILTPRSRGERTGTGAKTHDGARPRVTQLAKDKRLGAAWSGVQVAGKVKPQRRRLPGWLLKNQTTTNCVVLPSEELPQQLRLLSGMEGLLGDLVTIDHGLAFHDTSN